MKTELLPERMLLEGFMVSGNYFMMDGSCQDEFSVKLEKC